MVVLNCLMNQLIAGREQWDLYDWTLQGVDFERVKKKDKRIRVVKNWPKPKSIRDI